MASIWILIGIIILVVFIVMAISSKKQAIVVKMVFVIFLLLMLTLGYVYAKTNPDLSNVSGVMNFSKVYFAWLSNAFSNALDASGYISKQPWDVEGKNKTKTNKK
ncbi:hypothetical protein HYT25_00140 [Candidatus Pacearchaeota archaeon]|nr:hypothetical protein [Candidatus Pacearchaeota archaeon]